MRTKINITNYLTKGFVLATIAVSLMFNTTAQKTQDFAVSEKNASIQLLARVSSADNGKNSASVIPAKKADTEANLEAFLIKAAGINLLVSVNESENSEMNSSDESASLESFLINAAGLNRSYEICQDENSTSSDKDLENFLQHAANIDSNQENILINDSGIESQESDLTDFLVRAAAMDMCNLSTME